MRRLTEVASILLASILSFGLRASAQELKVGDPAPDFALKASDGRTYSLSQLRGKAVVLAWFPKAFTAG
jgi:peroxiredoxin Q/BCP